LIIAASKGRGVQKIIKISTSPQQLLDELMVNKIDDDASGRGMEGGGGALPLAGTDGIMRESANFLEFLRDFGSCSEKEAAKHFGTE
jgi:hypothetical protein